MVSLHSISPYTGDYHNLEPKSNDTSGKLEPVVRKECFDLPLSSSYLGVFLGTQGKHIKPLCSQYKVQMHLGEENVKGQSRRGMRQQYVQSSDDVIKVTVCSKPEDKADVEGFKEQLLKRATAVSESREKHQENVSFKSQPGVNGS